MKPAVKRVSFKEHTQSDGPSGKKRKDKKSKNDVSPLDFHPKPHSRIRVPANMIKFMEWLTKLDPVQVKCSDFSLSDKTAGKTVSRYSKFSRKRTPTRGPSTVVQPSRTHLMKPFSTATIRSALPKPRGDASPSHAELLIPTKGRWWFLNDVFATVTYPMVLWEMRRLMGIWLKEMKHADDEEAHLPPPLDPEAVPSSYSIRGNQWPQSHVKLTEFEILIEETSTFTLYIQDTSAAISGSESAEKFIEENERYRQALKKDKESFHKGTQVPASILLNKICGIEKPSMANKQTSVFISDILDATRIESSLDAKLPTQPRDVRLRGKRKFMLLKENPQLIDDIFSCDKEGNESCELDEAIKMIKVLRSSELTTVTRMMGRAIERKLNTEKLVLFKRGEPPDPEAKNVDILYTIKFMWTMKFPINACRLPVTCSCLNGSNQMLLAVGHGPFFMDLPEDKMGRVHIWNLRNNTVPEKVIKFNSCVTSVNFSQVHPFALLVGVLKGFLTIYDISKNNPTLLMTTENNMSTSLLFECKWFKNKFDSSEYVVSCGDCGTMTQYTKKEFHAMKMIDITRREGFLVGVPIPDDEPCKVKSAIHYKPAVFTMAQHPQNLGLFLVGTEEGCIQKCSLDTSTYLDVFQAHFGPVHKIKFHPSVPHVFLTVGVDYVVRIWAEGIYEPLLVLGAEDDESWHEDMYEDADWSPTHPHLMVSVNGPLAKLWDLRRFRREPWSVVRNPRGARFTQVLFHKAGFQFTVGDERGDVHNYTLSNLPFQPDSVNAPEVFVSCIRRVLLGNHEMLEKLSKLGYPFSDKKTIDEELNEP